MFAEAHLHNPRAALIACALLLVGATASAQPNHYLDFYTNEVPDGWIITPTRSGSNYGIADGRFYAGSTDSSSHLSTSFEPSGNTQSIEFRWDGNIARPTTGWGAQAAVQFGPIGFERYMTRWTTLRWESLVQIELETPNGGQSHWINVPAGDYRFVSVFTPTSVTFSGSLGGVEQFRFELAGISVDFGSVGTVELYTFQNAGPDVWMDNVWIQTTAVPEPQAFALLAIGGLFVAARSRAQRSCA